MMRMVMAEPELLLYLVYNEKIAMRAPRWQSYLVEFLVNSTDATLRLSTLQR